MDLRSELWSYEIWKTFIWLTEETWALQYVKKVSFDFEILYLHMYSDRQAWANSVDPVEMPQNVASLQGLHFLPLIQ